MRHDPSRKRLPLTLEPQAWRLPDRGRGFFGKGRVVATELAPQGRSNDIYGDVIVTLARFKTLESPRVR